MAVTVRSSSSAAGVAAAALTVTKPAGTVNGDLLVALLAQDTGTGGTLAGLTAPAGWTLLGSGVDAATYGQMKAFWKIASSEGASYTFGYNGTDGVGIVAAITAGTFDAGTPIPAAGFGYSSSTTAGTTITAPSVTGITGGLLLSGYGSVGATTGAFTFTPGGSQTDVAQVTAGASGHVAEDLARLDLAASGATTAQTATASSSRRWVSVSIAVSPSTVTNVALSDTGTAADGLSVAATVALTDAATSADTFTSGFMEPLAGDSATAVDALAVTATASPADTATAVEALAVTATARPADTATAADALAVTASIGITDSATTSDAMAVFYRYSVWDGTRWREVIPVVWTGASWQVIPVTIVPATS